MNELDPSPAVMRKRIEKALTSRLFQASRRPDTWPGYPCYARRIEDAVVHGLSFNQVRADLKRGGGGELVSVRGKPPKFHAAHSSCALMVNTLGIFRSSTSGLSLAGYDGFSSLEFEFPCPTGAGRGIASLDALGQGPGLAVGIESKLSEFLFTKVAVFSSKYESVVAGTAHPSWAQLYHELKSDPKVYHHVDAAQLLKHYLGLKARFKNVSLRLLYLFWEPTNATRFKAYRVHAQEVESITERLCRADVPVVPQRYAELWDSIEAVSRQHAERLRARYQVAL